MLAAHTRNRTPREQFQSGFTVVELLVVMAVIAILATIIFVAYHGIQDRAEVAVIESDLSQAAGQLAIDYARTGNYPDDVESADKGNGLIASEGTTYQYTVDNTGISSFCLTATNGDHAYYITNDGVSEEGVCPGDEEPEGGGGDVAVACSDYSIGDTGPAGGVIFYKDGTTCYEAAPAGWYDGTAPDDPAVEWGCYGTAISGAGGMAIGTGQQNTADIIAASCSPQTAGHLLAATIVAGYNGGGKNDWYLPGRDELHQMYVQRDPIGGFAASLYWSSSEYSAHYAWQKYFSSGGQGSTSKYNLRAVRPIRSFSD